MEPDAEAADLGTPEVIAAAVRRAASFTCPTTPRLLREAVEESLRGLLPEEGPGLPSGEEIDGGSDSSMRLVREALDNLVALGDLVEVPTDDEESGATRRMLFLGPTSYVRVSEDTVVLLGVRADGIPILDESLADRVEYRGHVRRIRLEPDEDPAALLGETGLGELSKGD
ncbi:uncharacterized protein METZ01_LOCUS448294, partial [marine metagenome]